MEVNQVIKLHLLGLSKDDKTQLFNVGEQYRQACNFVSEWVFNNGFELNSNKLHKHLYQDIRKRFGLKAQLAASVMKTVTARYKTVQTQMRQHPYRLKDDDGVWKNIPRDLEWLWKPVFFKRRQADYQKTRDYAFTKDLEQISVQTLGQRLKCDYTLKGFEQLLEDGWILGGAKLLEINNEYYLHIAAKKEVADFNPHQEAKHVVGIDRGLRFIVTTFDEKKQAEFFSGKQVLQKRAWFNKRRATLQHVGTKSAKRRLKQLSGRENRWMTDVNHQITKTLVKRYAKDTLFVLEDLTNVSFNRDDLPKSLRNSNSSWSFFQFEQFLMYKAEQRHSGLVKVSTQYTSQRCPACGFINKDNRNHETHSYHCGNCGYQSNDDRVGAMNIQELGKQFVSGVEKPKFTALKTHE